MELRAVSVPCLQSIEMLEATCNKLGLILTYKPDAVPSLHSGPVDEIFEVEKIVNYAKDPLNNEWYFVKWKGWPDENNSWEPKKNLTGCDNLLKKFDAERKKQSRKRPSAKRANPNNLQDLQKYFQSLGKPTEKSFLDLVKKTCVNSNGKNNVSTNISQLKKKIFKATNNHKHQKINIPNSVVKKWIECQQVQEKLKEWETAINLVSSDTAPIIVENYVDFEGPPTDFTYINDYKPGEGIIIPDDPLVGCECANCFENKKHCCATQCGGIFAYNKLGKVNVRRGTPIYECNKRCSCPPECPNRVVQHGRKYKVAIFRTSNGCGWGVRTLEPIKKDTFVMEYVGEVITNEEAEKRGQVYDAQGRTYLFDLDYNDGDCPFTVDAAFYGNVSHFMNHSCEPNLVVFGVWINTLDPRIPKLAFFSNKNIKAGEELTFDYMMTKPASNAKKNRISCKCGSRTCRKYLV